MSAATDVIMPVLGMSQDSGRLVRWLKQPGERVEKGEPLMEVETDKAMVEIEAPASGVLARVMAREGDEVPVTQVIAVIEGETGAALGGPAAAPVSESAAPPVTISASPLAARMAAEHDVDLGKIKPGGGRIEKADVLAYLNALHPGPEGSSNAPAAVLASPKARRLAAERGIDLAAVRGSGPGGAVLASDLPPVPPVPAADLVHPAVAPAPIPQPPALETVLPVSLAWSRMIERLSASWPAAPHFYLMREVNAARLLAWKDSARTQTGVKITITDVLVKLAAAALRRHPQVGAALRDGKLYAPEEINIGVAVAIDDGLLVPVIRRADTLGLIAIAASRVELVERARSGKLRPDDLHGGVFTISNLGMYGVDAFNAMINPGQAAILAVGRIAERVIALNGQPAVQPMMVLSLSCDHRVVDGARGAQFLQTLAAWIEDPLSQLN